MKKTQIQVLFVLIVLCLISGCMSYKRMRLPEEETVPVEKRTIQLITEKSKFYLYHVKFTQDTLYGKITKRIPKNSGDPELTYLNTEKKTSRRKLVHIYVDSTMNFINSAAINDEVEIPMSRVTKIDVYRVNRTRTVLYTVGGGIIVVFLLGLLMLAMNPIDISLSGL